MARGPRCAGAALWVALAGWGSCLPGLAAAAAAAEGLETQASRRAAAGAAEETRARTRTREPTWWWPFDAGADDLDTEGDLHPGLPPPGAGQARPRVRRPGARGAAELGLTHLGSRGGLRGNNRRRQVITPDARNTVWRHRARPRPGRDVQDDASLPPGAVDVQDLAPRTRASGASLATVGGLSGGAGVSTEDQCLKFALWAKQQDLQGPELVYVWKSTCVPAVLAGAATDKYATMCDALGGAVAGFASQPDWQPHAACAAVLQVFRESGIGASPLRG